MIPEVWKLKEHKPKPHRSRRGTAVFPSATYYFISHTELGLHCDQKVKQDGKKESNKGKEDAGEQGS